MRAVAERVVEQSEAAALGLARVCLERPFSTIRLAPTRGDCDQLLVQALGAAPIQRYPAEQDDAGDGVRHLDQAGA